MPDEKGLGSKILGVFFEVDPQKGQAAPADGDSADAVPEQSAADIVAELAKQSGNPAKKPAVPGPGATAVPAPARPAAAAAAGPPAAPANVDFDSVFKNAGMDSGELDRVRKAEELLKSLPEATPQDVKRQIVEASLKAFGFDIAKIASGAQNQMKALETFVRVNEQQTAKAITDAQNKISQLEEQIINLRVDIDKRTQNLASVAAAADVRKSQVQKVLEFFNVSAPPAPKT